MHTHPSGDPQPSADDIHLTHQIIAVGKPLKVAVHDHLIIGKHGHVSLKGLRMIYRNPGKSSSIVGPF
jgi:DNA repair protein RadC